MNNPTSIEDLNLVNIVTIKTLITPSKNTERVYGKCGSCKKCKSPSCNKCTNCTVNVLKYDYMPELFCKEALGSPCVKKEIMTRRESRIKKGKNYFTEVLIEIRVRMAERKQSQSASGEAGDRG